MGYKQEIAILDRLIKCEGSSWGSIWLTKFEV
jgi:hypothetical protein